MQERGAYTLKNREVLGKEGCSWISLKRASVASVQIVLCNFSLQINNIQKYYSVSLCVISIIIEFEPTQPLTKKERGNY